MPQQHWMNSATRVGVLAIMVGLADGAAAQDTATTEMLGSEGLALEEVVVTARKVEERLQDAPVAVTTLTGDILELNGIRDLAGTMKLASSLKFDSDADVRAGVAIRGVGQSSDVNAAPGVGMFVDGIYQPSSAYYTVPFFDIQRLEILKGPQGTLYGKNTMGGAISIISREPTDELGGSFMVEGATGSSVVANGVVNVPIVGDELANRTALFYRNADGLLRNETTGEDAAKRDDVAARSIFVYDPGDGFRSALSLFYADLKSAPFAYSTTNEGLNHPIKNVTKNINGKIVSKYKSVNFTNSLERGPVLFSSLTSYDRGDVDTAGDADFTALPFLTVAGQSNRDTYAQEFRLADSDANNSNLHWLVGAYFSDDDFKSDSSTEIVGRQFQSGTKHETGNSYAGFGQTTLLVGEFEFVAGVRYDRETRDNVSSNLAHLTGVESNFDENVVSEEWQPKASVSYHFTPDIMGYVLGSKGFRAGGFNAITAPPEYASYQPETTINYETGLKTELFDRRVRLNSAIFHTDYEDILLTDIAQGTDGSQVVYSRNGGTAESYGAELDGAFRVNEALTLSGGYTYLSIKNDDIPRGGVRRAVSGFAHNVFNFQADYTRPIGNGFDFGAHTNVSYIGETWMGTEPDKRDAVTVVDASLDLIVPDVVYLENVTISVFGKNVFDQKYYTSFIPASSTATGTSALGLLGPLAQFGVRVSAAF